MAHGFQYVDLKVGNRTFEPGLSIMVGGNNGGETYLIDSIFSLLTVHLGDVDNLSTSQVEVRYESETTFLGLVYLHDIGVSVSD